MKEPTNKENQVPELTGADDQDQTVTDLGGDHASQATPSRLLPAVVFGLRTAALAGIAVSAGAVAMGLTGVFDDSIAMTYTTCSTPF